MTGQTCDVSGFHQSFESLRDIPIAQVATAVTLESGETVILVINEALYFGNEMNHSLINPNQIRSNRIDVSDNPYDRDKDFGITHDECFIPFVAEGSTVYFDSFVPSDVQLETLRHIELTSSDEWDPTNVDMQRYIPQGNTRFVQQMNRNTEPREVSETDSHLASISEACCPSLFAKRMIESVHVESRNDHTPAMRHASEVISNTRHSVITPERVSRVFGVGLNAAKQTIAVTTQKGVRRAINPLNRRYRVDHLNLHQNRLGGQWYVDHMSAQKKSINQNTGAWVYSNGNLTKVYPVRTRSEVDDTLSTFCNDLGIPAKLKSDRAPELCGKGSSFYKYARKQHIDLTYAEPDRKNQISAIDTEIRQLKKRTRSKMVSRAGCGTMPWSIRQKSCNSSPDPAYGDVRDTRKSPETRQISQNILISTFGTSCGIGTRRTPMSTTTIESSPDGLEYHIELVATCVTGLLCLTAISLLRQQCSMSLETN